MHAQQISGMPMNNLIWMKDPPASSYPACIAVKSAALQSEEAGKRYLRLLRETIMLDGKNIAKENVLIEIAEKLTNEKKNNFDLKRFQADLKNDNGLEAFRKDLQETQYRNIKRFPTFIMKSPWHKGLIVTGYRPYSILLDSLKLVAPHLQKTNDNINREEYTNFWGNIINREAEAINLLK
jgi:predicted DsbA family dithiol-disulfide isomerase